MERWVAMLPMGFIGLVFIALAVPLAMRRVPPNPWYGFRVPRTMRSRAIWYESNAYGGRLMVRLGVLTIAAAAVLPVVSTRPPEQLMNAGAMAAVAGSLIVLGLWYRHLLTLDEPPEGSSGESAAPEGTTDLPGEMPPLKLTSAAFAFLGLMIVAISIPLVQRSVPPNGSYGFRTAETMINAQVWYEANAYSGWTMIAAGAVIVAASIVLAVSRRVSQRAYVPLMMVVLLGSLGISLALSFHHLAQIA